MQCESVCACVSLVMSAARSYVVYSSAAAQQMLTFFLYFRVLIMLEFNEMMMKKFVLRPILQKPRLLPQHLLKERIIQISLKVLFWSSGSLWVSVSASRQHVDDQSSSWRWWLLNWWTLWRVSFLWVVQGWSWHQEYLPHHSLLYL